jgi:para-aminobenzoate synthetase component I
VTDNDTAKRAIGHPHPTAGQGEVLNRMISGPLSPVDALDRLAGDSHRVLLETAGASEGFSLLASNPIMTLRTVEGRVTLTTTSGERTTFPNTFAGLSHLLELAHGMTPPEGVPFAGGIIGFLGYETGNELERLPDPPDDPHRNPGAWFGVYEAAVIWKDRSSSPRIVATLLPGRSRRDVSEAMDRMEEALLEAPAVVTPGGGGRRAPSEEVRTSLSREEFEGSVRRIRDYILAGDIFQANLTRRISSRISCSGPELYRSLRRESPAPYGAFLDCGDVEVASISPELFLSLRDARVITSPIKGTLPRGKDRAADRELRDDLARSSKDRAENIMIVDLLRNDLSRVCLPESVEVTRLAEVESHPTVHHLVSTVAGTLEPGKDVVDVLRATFPGGSVTGAPKIRAMEILRELEPVRRGVYTGALGVLGFHGGAELSVAIRTAVLRDGHASYGTGGGITLASDPEAEWKESEDKAAAFLRALGSGDASFEKRNREE